MAAELRPDAALLHAGAPAADGFRRRRPDQPPAHHARW